MLNELLIKKRQAVVERWFELILGTYPPDTAALMRKERNQFTNPVGSTISREIEVIFTGLLDEMNSERVTGSLESILKIRSLQDLPPSKAVGFVYLLKRAIEETLKGEPDRGPLMEEWLRFQAKLDQLALRAFDIYMDCREKICEIRVNQARTEKEMAFRVMERMTASKEKRKKEEE